MENPIEHLDLGFVNFTKHPTNPNYVVYRFADEERANSFRDVLIRDKISFEEDTEEKRQLTYTLFAVHKKNYKKTMQLNYEVESKHKKPLIPFKILRWSVVIFGMGILLLSILSYCKHMEHLQKQTEIHK
jgi:hypothetical protein